MHSIITVTLYVVLDYQFDIFNFQVQVDYNCLSAAYTYIIKCSTCIKTNSPFPVFFKLIPQVLYDLILCCLGLLLNLDFRPIGEKPKTKYYRDNNWKFLLSIK